MCNKQSVLLVCRVQRAVYLSVQCAVCSVRCEVCSFVQYSAVCSVQCVLGDWGQICKLGTRRTLHINNNLIFFIVVANIILNHYNRRLDVII